MSEENAAVDHAAEDNVDRAVGIVCAYVSHNSVPAAELTALIGSVHAALAGLSGAAAPALVEDTVEKPTPAQIKKSITHNALISFIDGKGYKTLKRHLTKHGLTPDAYKAKYGLPADYPTTAASYSEQRSALAKSLGLGQPGRAAATDAAEPAEKKPRSRTKTAPQAQAA